MTAYYELQSKHTTGCITTVTCNAQSSLRHLMSSINKT